ncbi:hypothetical protein LUZ60_004252 [Juncus effusus]|nr:hypothetical protein LUZ60_004252 [Juncus effusus]
MAPVRWVKEWVPQEVITPGGNCLLLKWVREDKLQALREKSKREVQKEEAKPEPNTETLFLCSYEGCRKAFTDHHLWRKHAPIHGERQYACHFEGCGKKFLDSSKLKRHFLIHTGERNFVCPHEGCHKAFSLDFNLRAHMKTHSLENYHLCPYPDCGKRYTQENKLNSHIRSHHQKNGGGIEIIKHTPPQKEKTPKTITPKTTPAKEPKTVSPNRPFACHYEGCNKAYIHQYKLNLHLRKEHPDHEQQVGVGNVINNNNNGVSSSSGKKGKREAQQERLQEMRPQKIARKEECLDVGDVAVNADFDAAGADFDAVGWRNNSDEEDSEETEDERDSDDDDDEETEDED